MRNGNWSKLVVKEQMSSFNEEKNGVFAWGMSFMKAASR